MATIEALKSKLTGLSSKAFQELAPYTEGMDFDQKGMDTLAAKEAKALLKEAGKYAIKK